MRYFRKPISKEDRYSIKFMLDRQSNGIVGSDKDLTKLIIVSNCFNKDENILENKIIASYYLANTEKKVCCNFTAPVQFSTDEFISDTLLDLEKYNIEMSEDSILCMIQKN
jgi:hypothetical protein